MPHRPLARRLIWLPVAFNAVALWNCGGSDGFAVVGDPSSEAADASASRNPDSSSEDATSQLGADAGAETESSDDGGAPDVSMPDASAPGDASRTTADATTDAGDAAATTDAADAGYDGPPGLICEPIATGCDAGVVTACAWSNLPTCVSHYQFAGSTSTCFQCNCAGPFADIVDACLGAQHGCENLETCCAGMAPAASATCYDLLSSYVGTPDAGVNCRNAFDSFYRNGQCN